MQDSEAALKVQMLGGFNVTYKDKTVSFGRNNMAKSIQLFQIMMINMEKGIGKRTLVEALYGRDEVENGNSSLNNTIFRLRRQLETAGLPEDPYIEIKSGVCTWSKNIPVWIDVLEFEELVEKAEKTSDLNEKTSLYMRACALYRGEFLPIMIGEEWATVANVAYQEMYFKCLREVSELLKQQREYEKVYQLCTTAAQIYPFEEWQILRIDSLIAMNRYKEAMEVYEEATKMFFDELGLTPSKKMLERFQAMSGHIQLPVGSLTDIKEEIQEDCHEEGAYYCTFPSFIDNYRLVSRMMERNGISSFLMLCTLTDSTGRPLEKTEKTREVSERFQMAVRRSLRRGDLYTRYSPCQFLLLLSGTNQENCSVISRRIDKTFKEEGGGRNKIRYLVTSVVDMKEHEADRLSFSNVTWN